HYCSNRQKLDSPTRPEQPDHGLGSAMMWNEIKWPNEPESSAVVGPYLWSFPYSAIIDHPLATARGAPSDVRLRTLYSDSAGSLTRKVDEPPPSRLMDSVTPRACINCPRSVKLMP